MAEFAREIADQARDDHVATFKALLASGNYSDFTITCETETFKVHKAVVCSRSGFFERAERFGIESVTNLVDLPTDDPAMVKLLLQYMYEGEYEPQLETIPIPPVVTGPRDANFHYKFPHTCKPKCPNPQHRVCQHHQCNMESCKESCSNFICYECCSDVKVPEEPNNSTQIPIHAAMYAIADKYDVKGLQPLSREKFKLASIMYWDSEDFIVAARYAFESTPEGDAGLRDVIVKRIVEHQGLLNKPEIDKMLDDFHGLAKSVLKRRAKSLGWIKDA